MLEALRPGSGTGEVCAGGAVPPGPGAAGSIDGVPAEGAGGSGSSSSVGPPWAARRTRRVRAAAREGWW